MCTLFNLLTNLILLPILGYSVTAVDNNADRTWSVDTPQFGKPTWYLELISPNVVNYLLETSLSESEAKAIEKVLEEINKKTCLIYKRIYSNENNSQALFV